MSNLTSAFSYSIGKKLIMGLTGLFLISFLVVHLAGNLLLFKGEIAFNEYSEFMGHNPLIRTMEIVLFAGFLFHIVDGLMLAMQNRKARPVGYAVNAGSKNSTLFSRIMPHTGVIMLVFLVLHLVSFFVHARFGVDVGYEGAKTETYMISSMNVDPATIGLDSEMVWSPYHKAVALFSVPWYSIFYIVAMAVISLHLLHGFQSAFQTVGFRHKKYFPIIKALGVGYAILIPAAFAAIPVYFLINPN